MQQTAIKERRNLLAVFTVAAAAAVFACGCGNQYRPVVTAINPVGPAGQPTGQYAVAISNPGPDPANPCQFLPGLLTFVDVSGDTVLSTPNILQLPTLSPALPASCGTPTPVNPNMFALNAAGATTTTGTTTTSTLGYVVNPQGSFNEFPLSSPTTLLTQDVVQTALVGGADPISMSAISVGTIGETVFVTQAGTPPSVGPSIAALSVSPTPSLLQPINLDPGQIPGYVVGVDTTQRVYAISQDAEGNGEVSSIESTQSNLAKSATLAVQKNPVYGVMTADTRRAFILNEGSDSISVINGVNNALDSGLQLPNVPAGTIPLPAGTNPIWADLATVNSQLAVLGKGNGTNPGTLTIINIPLCNIASPTGNPTCNLANPTDALNFGTILGTVPVGVNPSMVSVLSDGTKAYVVNSSDPVHCSSSVGSVSVVNLSTFTVTATICGVAAPAGSDSNANPTLVHGTPNTVASTAGKPTGKVYVTAADSEDMTIIRTDEDIVETHISLQGVGIRVLTTQR